MFDERIKNANDFLCVYNIIKDPFQFFFRNRNIFCQLKKVNAQNRHTIQSELDESNDFISYELF